MKQWWTSDQHFGHANIIRYCNRPFQTVEEMDQCIIDRWNERVGEMDEVFVVGDFSFHDRTKTQAILNTLHGRKVLFMGNHDERKTKTYWKSVGFHEVHDNQEILLHPTNEMVFVSHIPLFEHRLRYQICGHVHNQYTVKPYVTNKRVLVNVGVDRWQFFPVSADQVAQLFLEGKACH